MNSGAIQFPQVKIARGSPTEDEAFGTFKINLVVPLETMHQSGCRVSDVAPVALKQLPIAFPNLFDQQFCRPWLKCPTSNNKCIVDMGLLDTKKDSAALGKIPKGVL